MTALAVELEPEPPEEPGGSFQFQFGRTSHQRRLPPRTKEVPRSREEVELLLGPKVLAPPPTRATRRGTR